MDFFASQEKARRKSFILLIYYFIAIILIVAFFNFIALAVVSWFGRSYGNTQIIIVTLVTLCVVIGFSLKRYFALREGGGIALAEMLGAYEVGLVTDNPVERKLRNITEEMAIASGTPMPALYVLERERGINAFVAGYTPNDMVLVITRGALEQLTRRQLQCVTAHEFSHIFHGDTRINLFLMALLAGITVVGETGRNMMESAGRGALQQVKREKEERHGFHIFPFLLGAVIAAIGYIGVLLARIIKSAISRQREFLADAAAVQFTRDRDGMTMALNKINQSAKGTGLLNRYAEEVSHLCFMPPLYNAWGRLLAAHPPTEERIIAIDKLFFTKQRAAEREQEESGTLPEEEAVLAPPRKHEFGGVPLVDPALATLGVTAAVAASIGNPTPQHLRYARSLQRSLPLEVIDAVHKPQTAPLVIYALLLGKNRITLQNGGKLLAQQIGKESVLHADNLRKLLQKNLLRLRLPLLDLAMPALKKIPPEACREFFANVDLLVKADGKVSLFEYAVEVLLTTQLEKRAKSTGKTLTGLAGLEKELGLLISLVVQTAGYEDKDTLYERSMRAFMPQPPPRPDKSLHTPAQLGNALNKLAKLAPALKKELIHVCVNCIMADNQVVPEEMEVLRIVAETLECPMPPIPRPV